MSLIFSIIFILSAILTIFGNIYSNINNDIKYRIIILISYILWCITFLYNLANNLCKNSCGPVHLRLSSVFMLLCFFIINLILKLFENKLQKETYDKLIKSTYSIPLTASILFCLAAFYTQFNLTTFNVNNIYGMSGSLLLLISSLLSITNNYNSSIGVSSGMLMLIIQTFIIMYLKYNIPKRIV